MVRKILKWIGIVLGGLIGLLVVAFIALYLIGSIKWKRLHGQYEVPVETVAVPTDAASIARGEHVVTIHLCKECHMPTLSGQVVGAPALFTFGIPNLTSGTGGVGGTNTDADWVRAIRHGVGHDGRGLALMPSYIFYYLSDEDLGAVIAYLKSLPPVDDQVPPTDLGPVGRVMLALGQLPPEMADPAVIRIDHSAPRPASPKPGATKEYGEYLTHICKACHGERLNGQIIRQEGEYLAPNLTPGGELATWSEEEFKTALRTGVTPTGHKLLEVMPWKYVGQMTDEEMGAVWLYLQSLPALPQGK
jgi:mono/diheme cytochrome c family protein